jgi:hypothetical protein
MRGKCPKCGAVFEIKSPFGLGSLIHAGSLRLTKCPACGKTSMMNNFVTDPITWPAPVEPAEKPVSEDELRKKQLDESRYEDSNSS